MHLVNWFIWIYEEAQTYKPYIQKNLVNFRFQLYITVNRQINLRPAYEIFLIIWEKIKRFFSTDIHCH
jgi:hypothetical protein